jgi:two-component system, chemotaxis family, chemotaxis protein CheY
MTTPPRTVLVVDDSPTVRQLIELNLRKVPNVRVVHATDGKQALEKIESEKPSLVLSDVNMPNMNGLELVEAIRRIDKTLPVVLITTKGDPGDAEKGTAAGATAYITKPINGAQLIETVRTLLG